MGKKIGQEALFAQCLEEVGPILDEQGLDSFFSIAEMFHSFNKSACEWLLGSGARALSVIDSKDDRRTALEIIIGMGKANWSVGIASFKKMVEISETDHGFHLDWLENAASLASVDQDVAVEYLNASPKVLQHLGGAKFSEWAGLGNKLAGKSWRAAKEYFKASPEAVTKIEPGDMERWVGLGIDLVEKSPKIKAKHKAQSLLAVGALAGKSKKLDLGIQYFKSAPQILSRLSMNDIEKWVEQGLQVTDQHKTKGNAFFSLQTSSGRQAVEGLVQGLELKEIHTVLRPYAEALAESKVLLRSSSLFYKNLPGLARFLSVTDGANIFLPSQISVFGDEDLDFMTFKLSLAHEIAHQQHGTFELTVDDVARLNGFHDSAMAFRVFEFLEDERVDFLMGEQYPGLVKDRAGLAKKYLAKRADEPLSVFESICFGVPQNLENAGHFEAKLASLLGEAVQKIKSTSATAQSTLDLAYDIYKQVEGDKDVTSETERKTPERPFYRGVLDFELVKNAKVGMENLLEDSMSRFDDKFDDLTKETVLEAFDRIEENEGIEPEDLIWRVDDPEKRDDLFEVIEMTIKDLESEKAIRRTVHYDEWNNGIDDYNKSWCKVREMDMAPSSLSFYNEAIENNYGVVSQLRRHFSMLRPDRIQRFFREERGDDIDYSALIESIIDRKAGLTPSDKVYIRREKNLRDVSVAFLVDMSYSTSDEMPSGKRIIDVEKEGIVLMAEALESIGDQWAVYGFSTKTKEKVDFYVIHDFDDQYDDEVKMRFEGMKPMAQTRLGAVIRHASSILKKQSSRIRILILLSDGRPYDVDYGDSTYSLEDTRMALMEGRRQGLTYFCITVDKKSSEYLPYMYGESNFTVINNVEALPVIMPLIYKRLTS